MLTAKQEKFCQLIVEGKSQADAYREAYPKQRCSDKTVWEAASRLMANSKVNARIKELRDKIASPSIMTAQERLEYLTRVVNGLETEKVAVAVYGNIEMAEEPAAIKTRLNAIDIMNKMTGEYVTKVDGNINITKLEDLL